MIKRERERERERDILAVGGGDDPVVTDNGASTKVLATVLKTALPRPLMSCCLSAANNAVYCTTLCISFSTLH